MNNYINVNNNNYSIMKKLIIMLSVFISLFSLTYADTLSSSNNLLLFDNVNVCLANQDLVTIGYESFNDYQVLGTDTDYFSSKVMEALDFLEARGGGILFIRNGTYYLDNESISGAWNNIKLTGDMPTIKNIASVTYSVDNFFNMIRLTGDNNIIENIIIDGNQQNNGVSPELHGIRITGNYNTVQNTYINNSRDPIILDTGDYNLVNNNIITNVAEFGITIRSGSDNNIVSNNIIKDTRGVGSVAITMYGIKVDGTNYNIVSNNLVDNARVCINTGSETYLTLEGNTLLNCDTGINAGNTYNSLVTGNLISHVLNGSGINWQGDNSTISNNKIADITSTAELNYGIYLQGSCDASIASNNDLYEAAGGDGEINVAVGTCYAEGNRLNSNAIDSRNVDYNIYNGNVVLESPAVAGTQSITIEGFKNSGGSSYAELIFWNRGDADYQGAKIASQNDGNNNDGNLEFYTTNGASTALSMSLDQVGNMYVKDLVGTYGGGSAYVCVLDSGILYASDAACP